MSDQNVKLPASLLEYYDRIGAHVLNFRRAMVRTTVGKYYRETCSIKVDPHGNITCSDKSKEPNEQEARRIKEDWATARMPAGIEADSKAAHRFAKELEGDAFVFLSRTSGAAIMIQQRVVREDGSKDYIPWTFFDDGQWRPMEPDRMLPLWKPAVPRSDRIMIHEGAKAAQAAEAIATDPSSDHPWHEDLKLFEHWGMIGGALTPHRTDWDELRKQNPVKVVYFCDNDDPGIAALQDVSRSYGQSLLGISLDPRWPAAWDMADPMPRHFFTASGRFHGPGLLSLLRPATWATKQILTGGQGRPAWTLTDDFANEWFHAVVPEIYAHREFPNEVWGPSEFNHVIRPFSNVDDTARLIKMRDSTMGSKLKYIPNRDPGIFMDQEGVRCINTHVPSLIKEEQGDPQPWFDYLEHLIPHEGDRHELMRWCATLIHCRGIKMLYGLLLISEKQGVGKSTLGEKILAPLVGWCNCSSPSESQIVDSDFNDWAAHKRLAVVHEIYAGHSSKAYDKLKGLVTDKVLRVNKKYQASYEMDNWLHILACSNSYNAIKLSIDDRRWLVPGVTETTKPKEYWEKFVDWLNYGGGLGIIKKWARDFLEENKEHVVMEGESSPMSAFKKDVIEDGWSEGMKIVGRFLEEMKEIADQQNKVVMLLDRDLVALVKDVLYEGRGNQMLERPLTLRKVAKAKGWYVNESKIRLRNWGSPNSFDSKLITNDYQVSQMSQVQLMEIGKPLNLDEMRKMVSI